MKVHHAISSALAGWLLMTPPIRSGSVDLSAPLAEWNIESRYDSAAQCQDAKDKEVKAVTSSEAGWSVSSSAAEKRATIKAIQADKCVAGKDPRLEER
jgi:hypothetical protein